MVAKVAGGIIGLGLIGTGGVAFVKPEWLGINKEVPWTPLSQDKDFNAGSGPYTGTTFGGKYKDYLTGIKGKEEGSNDAWWQKSHEQWKEDYEKEETKTNLGNKFKEPIAGPVKPKNTNVGTDQYLKDICDAIYKAESGKVKASANVTDEYKESSVWKYCSPLGEKPKTISETDADSERYKTNGWIGKEETDRQKLISTTGNKKFWEIREKEFRGQDGYKKIETTKDAFFDPESKQTHIKDLCEEAYGKESSNTRATDKPNKDKALKYCSLDKSSN